MPLKWYGEELIKKMHEAARKGIDETTTICVAKAKPKMPVDTTELQGAIQMRPARREGAAMVGRWGAFNCAHAVFVELGTEPHFPPVEALKPWARRKLGDEDLAFAVAVKISKVGTKPQPVLRPTADEEYPKLTRRIKKHFGN